MPNSSKTRESKLLSNVSVKYQNAEYIADQVFPIVNVKKQTDKYRIYERNFRLPETIRANRAESKLHDFDVTTASYALERHALKDYISDTDKENYEHSTLEVDLTEELTDKLLLRMEYEVSKLFTSTSWSQNVSLAATAQFSANTTVSNPIPKFDTAQSTIMRNCGMSPNYAIIPHDVLIAMKNHVSILDRIKYTSAQITVEMIKGLLSIDSVLVPKASLDSSAEGQTASIGAMWNDNCFVGYKPNRPGMFAPSAGYIFMNNSIPRVKKWRDEERESDAIEVNAMYQPKVVASLSGYLIKDCLA